MEYQFWLFHGYERNKLSQKKNLAITSKSITNFATSSYYNLDILRAKEDYVD